ncbi:hypothetical protein F5Y16DRAFT_411279 [Xylariaceae sp. FL0255]|nr:hypothetical protein F5Y16DRAFT_411279 [Xylariaceae sp. FL0255]
MLFDDDDDDDESTKGPDTHEPGGNKVSQDRVLFQDWLRDNRATVYKKSHAREIYLDGAAGDGHLFKSEESAIISSPREYQTELFERAKQKNIIAVLDTGTGKTLIAALLLRHIVQQELEDRRVGQAHRLAFFLVDKIALVHQQYRVLKANLDFSMDSFSGDSGDAMYSQAFWDQLRENRTVIVCTAGILDHCLHHAFIKMEHINLLIFDEAHHAKKNHNYARIIKDFYAPLEKTQQKRPRILGMTASPVDAKTDVASAAAKLEGLLHCEIATVADLEVFKRASINKATEKMIEYFRIPYPIETPLWQKLHKLVGRNPGFSRLFTYSKECTVDLGRWCADRMWQLLLTDDQAKRIEARTERDFTRTQFLLPVSALDAEREAVQQACQEVREHTFTEVTNNSFDLSFKVITMIKHLQQHFDPECDKCVVFADQRLTVALLADLFNKSTLGLQGYRAGTLIGAARANSGDIGMSLTEQKSTIQQFRNGELNILFATSAGEEGIDIPDCNIVVRFDLAQTMIQYIQSRGRARRKDSVFLHLVEAGNFRHKQSIMENQDHEAKLREFCSTLPEDRLVLGSDYDIEYHLSKEKNQRTYTVPTTGAKLTYKVSLSVLANFVSSLPHPPDVHVAPDYIMHAIGSEFGCEVILPDISPIKSAVGRRASSKQVAKCSAAFEMCLKLRKEKHLDENLRSTFTKVLPLMRNARLAISSKKRAQYPIKMKPNAWSILDVPEKLFITVIQLSDPEALDRPSKPLAILTRVPLPNMASFPIYFGKEKMSEVRCVPLLTSFESTPKMIEEFTHFTLRIFYDVFSKLYEFDPSKMPYLFAPLAMAHGTDWLEAGANPLSIIDWDCLHATGTDTEYTEWENQPEEIFDNKFIVDPHDGSRKFFTTRRRPDLSGTDPQKPGVRKSQHFKKNKQDAASDDIWNFSVSLWSRSRARITRNHNLLVVEAELIPLRRNLLDKFEVSNEQQRQCFLVFETLKISMLPVDVVVMAYNLPPIIYRLESNLIALEACQTAGLAVKPDLALEAMTKDSENTEAHSDHQVNFQRGMGKNYERLEFLGDCFLKMSTTIALFTQKQECDEFQYHVERMVLICNKNLFNNALEMKLEESIRTKAFSRRTWYPEGIPLLKGKQNTSILGKKAAGSGTHALADKSIADVCEALIGAAYMTTYNENNFDLAIQAVTKFVNHPDHRMTTWPDYYAAYKIPEWQSGASTAVQLDLARQIEEKMGYKFQYPRLLRSAFTHPSYGSMYEKIPHYQRLEFLGDSLLDMVCVNFLFHRFPEADPQWLTEHKMAMVSNQFLGCLCVSLNFQRHMLSMTSALQKEITDYVTSIEDAKAEAEDDAEAAGLSRSEYKRNFWTSQRRPPKALPDIVESYMGALFVDSEYDYSEVQRFFHKHIRPYFEDITLYDTFANNHPVTLLSSILSTEFHCTRWRVFVDETDDEDGTIADKKVIAAIMIHGVVRESASADSGRYARPKAAQKLLKTLQQMDRDEFRKKFNCTCETKKGGVYDVEITDHASAA